MAATRRLEILFRDEDWPFATRDEVETPLDAELMAADVGEITGGGIGGGYYRLEVDVTDLERGLEVVRQTLRRLRVPASTTIRVPGPEVAVHRV